MSDKLDKVAMLRRRLNGEAMQIADAEPSVTTPSMESDDLVAAGLGVLLARVLRPNEDMTKAVKSLRATIDDLRDTVDDEDEDAETPDRWPEALELLQRIADRPDPPVPRPDPPVPPPPPPEIDLAPVTDAITALDKRIESLSQATGQLVTQLTASLKDIAKANAAMMKAIDAVQTAATAPRHVITDVNGDVIGVRIGG